MRLLLDTHAVLWWLADDPRAFYSERFRKAFRDAGESVGSAGEQLAGWLRRDGSDGDGG